MKSYVPVRKGYKFLYWTDGTSKIEYPSTMPGDLLDIYAVWEENTNLDYICAVYEEELDGSKTFKKKINKNNGVTGHETTLTKNNFNEKDGFNIIVKNIVIDPNVNYSSRIVEVIYERKINTITLKDYYGKDAEEKDLLITQKYGSALVVKKPSIPNYQFNGWKDNSGNISYYLPSTIPANDTVYTAIWEKNEYEVYIDMPTSYSDYYYIYKTDESDGWDFNINSEKDLKITWMFQGKKIGSSATCKIFKNDLSIGRYQLLAVIEKDGKISTAQIYFNVK